MKKKLIIVAIIATIAAGCNPKISESFKKQKKEKQEQKTKTWSNPRFGGLVLKANFI